MGSWNQRLANAILAGALGLLVPGLVVAQPTTTRVSVGPGGAQGNEDSWFPAISADGRWVAFDSWASTLVADDTNGVRDVFVHDRQTGATERVSVATDGTQGDGDSRYPAISADGRWIAFESLATTLVAADTNGYRDVFLHDRQTRTTTRVSVGPAGAQGNAHSYAPAISADGRWVAFDSSAGTLVAGDTNGGYDVFVRDTHTGTTARVSVRTGGAQGNGGSAWPAISADGRWVAFESADSMLVVGDTNSTLDAFVHDRQTGTTTRVSVGPGGAEANGISRSRAISADGRWVAFESYASNLVPGDTNGEEDVFVHDRQTGTTARASVGPGNSQGNGVSYNPAISANGRWVTFQSQASNLVGDDTNGMFDVFVHDIQTGTTTRVSLGLGGVQGNGESLNPSISGDGRLVSFQSAASDLVPDDTNGVDDVLVRDRGDAGCAVTLVPAFAWAPAAGATGSVAVLGPAACAWTAVSNDPGWLAVTGGASGTGFGMVDYSVAPNTGAPRTGTITVEGQTFTVTQVSVTTPMAPEALAVHSVVGNIVTLRWTIPPIGPAPTSFVLEGGVNPGEVLASLGTGSSAPTYTFAAPSGSFYARMHGLNGGSRSAASNEIRIHVGVPVTPSAPANLLGMVSGSTLALAWRNTYGGGAPTSLALDVTGAIVTSLPLALGDTFSFAGVPNGTYTLALRAVNAGGSSPPSNAVTVTFPGPCSGPPLVPTDVLAYRVGNTVFVDWAPGTAGPAPTGYVLNVTGSFVGSFATNGRSMSGTVGPGSYTLSVSATNTCGSSAGTTPQTVVVP